MKIGQLIKAASGRIGVIVANENNNGVSLGHCCVWFGCMPNNEPLVEHLLISKDWEMLETPLGV